MAPLLALVHQSAHGFWQALFGGAIERRLANTQAKPPADDVRKVAVEVEVSVALLCRRVRREVAAVLVLRNTEEGEGRVRKVGWMGRG